MFPMKKSLAGLFLSNIFIVILLITIPLGYLLISNEYKQFNEQTQQFREDYTASRKEIIKDEIEVVLSYIHFKKDLLSASRNLKKEDIQKEILQWINKIRVRQNQYIIVNKFDGTILAHYKPQNIGKNMWDFTDQNGVKPVQEAIRISKNPDGGYLNYVGSVRPSTGKPGKKMTYAKSVPEWEWTVLTGAYMDDIDIATLRKKAELKTSVRNNIIKIVTILLLVILMSLIIANLITRRLKSNFSILSAFFEKAASRSEKIDRGRIHFSEFQDLTRTVNRMTQEKNLIHAELRRHQSQLEELVLERTQALEASNLKLADENRQRRQAEEEKEQKIKELQDALLEIKNLQGLLPICSSCKKIRDDKGYWQQIESYIEEHSDAVFSHSMCPGCVEKLYGDKDWYPRNKPKENKPPTSG